MRNDSSVQSAAKRGFNGSPCVGRQQWEMSPAPACFAAALAQQVLHMLQRSESRCWHIEAWCGLQNT